MIKCDNILQLLKELNHGNTSATLSVIGGKNGVAFARSAGAVTIKTAEDGRKYTVSIATFKKIEPYLQFV